jgi:hypothetical protein
MPWNWRADIRNYDLDAAMQGAVLCDISAKIGSVDKSRHFVAGIVCLDTETGRAFDSRSGGGLTQADFWGPTPTALRD